MLRTLYYRLRYGPYLESEDGLKNFAERCVTELVRKLTKKTALYRQTIERLHVERSALHIAASELPDHAVLDQGQYVRIRRRLWSGT